ncbi:MAG: divalent metal cation transporter [Bacteroidota bacterium]
MRNKLRIFLKTLGPGMLYAGAAIGVSHLIQSTRAGASYGWWPILAIVFIHLAKYPFFRAGPNYALATNSSLIEGYSKRGKPLVWLFVLITVGTMFTIIAAIVAVTGGICSYFLGLEIGPNLVSFGVLAIATVLLLIGGYSWLDKTMKVIILLLGICTLIAFTSALFEPVSLGIEKLSPAFDGLLLIMLIKLMGWMPAPLDLSVWHSLWVLKKRELTGHIDSTESKRDFNFGYWGTMIMGLLFLGMGAMILHGSGEEIPSSGVAFSNMLIGMYTSQLGQWAFYIVGIAAIATMLSTTLTCLDAIPRSLVECKRVLAGNQKKLDYPVFLIILGAGSIILLTALSASMTTMVDIATIISFCSAPVIAWMNFKVIRGKEVSSEFRPSRLSTQWEIFSIASLSLLSIAYFLV